MSSAELQEQNQRSTSYQRPYLAPLKCSSILEHGYTAVRVQGTNILSSHIDAVVIYIILKMHFTKHSKCLWIYFCYESEFTAHSRSLELS